MIYAIPLLILAYQCDPALAALFTPRHPQAGRYDVCTTTAPIEEVVRERHASGLGGPVEIDALEPLDAFGAIGAYDRSALAELYGATRVRVARMLTNHEGRFESLTLLSPHPDLSLTHLLPGTMVIRFSIGPRP